MVRYGPRGIEYDRDGYVTYADPHHYPPEGDNKRREHCKTHGHYWDRLSIDCTAEHCKFGGERGECFVRVGEVFLNVFGKET